MALVRFKSAVDYVAGFVKAFGNNSGYIQAVTLVDDAGAAVPGGGDASAANQATQITAEQAIQATAGATTGAAVVTDANGTIQQYLRGLVVLFVNFLTRLPAALAANGGLKVEGVAGGVAAPVSGPQTNTEYLAANRCTVTKTSVNSANSSTQLLAATAGRKSLTIVNTDANTLFIDTSGGTATNACIPLLTGLSWSSSGAVPVGIITGIWAADGAGAATIFEGA